MRKGKKLCSMLLAMALTVTTCISGIGNDKTAKATTDNGQVVADEKGFRDLSATQITQEMGTGWNLGNTMESLNFDTMTPGETEWDAPVTTQRLIDSIHDMGFNTLRIPISYGSMINDEDYSIQADWMNRIREIVDYGVSQDMYVVINIHHDGCNDHPVWLNMTDKTEEELEVMYKKFSGVWTTIANYFKEYDEHLLFEGMNEVSDYNGTDKEQSANEQLKVINRLNQTFADTVRATGGNNAKRWIITPTTYTKISIAIGTAEVPEYDFHLPDDKVNRVMLSVHNYDNYGVVSFGTAFQKLNQKYVKKGVPVFMGEYGYGAVIGEEKRAYFYEGINRLARQYGIIPVVWDNHYKILTNDGFQIIDRVNAKSDVKEVTDGLMRGFYNEGSAKDIVKDDAFKSFVKSNPLTQFTVSTKSITMKKGDMCRVTVSEKMPTDNNDVVLWKTADKTIATVSNGRIRARGIGSTTITAFTQNGNCTQEIQVTVSETAQGTDSTPIYDEEKYPEIDYDTLYLLPKGASLYVDGNQYKVTVSEKESAEVMYIGTANNKKKEIDIPASVVMDGFEYKVTAIAEKALSGKKNLTKVTIGSNVKKIGAKAFYGSSKLANIFVKSMVLKSTGAKAFTGTKKHAVVKVPASKAAKYKKLLKTISSPVFVKVDGLSANAKVTEGYIAFQDGNWSSFFNNGEDVSPIVMKKATVTGEGKYTVSLDYSKTATGYSPAMNFIMIGVANGEKLFPKYCLNITGITINGKKVSYKQGYTTSDDSVTTRMNVYNKWASITDNNNNGSTRSYDGNIKNKTPKMIDFEKKYAEVKIKTISIEFTYAKKNPLAVKKTFTKGDFKYRVTDFKEVSVVGLTKKAMAKKTLEIPASVTQNGISYQITRIGKNAMKGMTKLKAITLGANIIAMETGAFANCSNLSKVTCYGTLKKVAKNTFKKCKAVTVTGWDVSTNEAIIKKSGVKTVK